MLKFTRFVKFSNPDLLCITFNSYLRELEDLQLLDCFYFFLPKYTHKMGLSRQYETKWTRMGKKEGLPNYLFIKKNKSVFIYLLPNNYIDPPSLHQFRKIEQEEIPVKIFTTVGNACRYLKEEGFIKSNENMVL